MRAMSRPIYAGRGSLAPSHIGFPDPYGDAAAKEQSFGQQQYRDWEEERESLLELIGEAEHGLGAEPDYVGMDGELTVLSLRATYARLARLERLMAAHPEWRPSP